jgi:hypothetical protein
MRKLIILICSVALVSAYGAQQDQKKPQQKKQGQPNQQVARHPAGAGAAAHKPMGAGGQNVRKAQPSTTANQRPKGKTAAQPAQHKANNQTSAKAYDNHKTKQGQISAANHATRKGNKNQNQVAGQTVNTAKRGQVKQQNKPEGAAAQAANRGRNAKATAAKPIKPPHFNVPKQPNTAKAPPVKFQQNRRIQGSQNWQGQQYTVFRNYRSQWHDQSWWHSHYGNNITFVFGAPYYWNAGYWFPAWGYYPNAYYAWDGPIYGYNHLPPDQVIANVQAALQQQGYYHGEVDGLIGPLTRGAIADYQRDHGLYTTSTIDQPTLESLGMA